MGKLAESLWVAQSGNTKTDNVIAHYAGSTVDEVKGTCRGCPLAWEASGPFARLCYAACAQRRGFASIRKAMRRHGRTRYSLDNAIRRRRKASRMVRLGAWGDPAKCRGIRRDIRRLRKLGLAVFGYTHFWRLRRNRDLAAHLVASCETWSDARDAASRGFVVSLLVHPDAPDAPTLTDPDSGLTVVMCPAQRKEGVTCEACRLCDPQHKVWKSGKVQGVGLRFHGNPGTVRRAKSLPMAGRP